MSKIKNTFMTALSRIETKAMLRMAGCAPAKTEQGDHLLEVLGTIIIAVVILIIFKERIVNIFTSALDNTAVSVENLFSNAYSGEGL